MTQSSMILTTLLLIGFPQPTTPLHLLGAFYRADESFPAFVPFWRDTTAPQDVSEAATLGGSVHVFVRNASQKPLQVEDVLLEGVSLKQAIALSAQKRKQFLHPASPHFSRLPPGERGRLLAAGEPVWWRVDPQPIPPNGTAEVLVRLRHQSSRPSLQLKLQSADGALAVSVPVQQNHPRIAGISFSPQRDTVYLYLQRHGMPQRILMDGQDLTAHATVGYDEAANIVPVVVQLKSPLPLQSFHCFQAIYADGVTASAGVRAWSDEFIYGMWGSQSGKEGDAETARRYLRDLHAHNLNAQMEMVGSAAVREFLKSEEGQRLLRSLNIRRMVSEPGKGNTKNPLAFFLVDEPDCGDSRVEDLPPPARVGSLAQSLVQRSHELRAADPLPPHLLNVDMTYKPHHWHIYGQLPDIFAADPYYQERLRSAYWEHPERLPLYVKATYIYAVGSVCQSACAPKPLHLILNSVCHTQPDRRFRYATPSEKRIEVYYALAAGAKGISYWRFTPTPPYVGVGADDPAARALWREIGLLGAEMGTAGPVLVRSCPATLSLTASPRLWVRSLLAGLDTVVLLCINDDCANDRVGTVIQPLEKAEVTVPCPAWLQPQDVFEITAAGIRDVAHERSGTRLTLRLGHVEVTRLLLITADAQLRQRLQSLYQARFAANVQQLLEQK